MTLTKKDFIFSVITGLTTGIIAWKVFVFLNISQLGGISYAWLIVIVPVLWIIGVNLGYFLGKWFSFFKQFGKFAAIGFTNGAVDFGVLNLLIATSNVSVGILYSIFKSISFVVAMLHSYFWNKHWSFESGESTSGGVEFTKFMLVTIVSFVINVGVASFVVNFINPFAGITPEIWANLGAVMGSATALAFSFLGFKIFVFKK